MENYANLHCSDPDLLAQKKQDSRNMFIAHLNINSVQNKVEELRDLPFKILSRRNCAKLDEEDFRKDLFTAPLHVMDIFEFLK